MFLLKDYRVESFSFLIHIRINSSFVYFLIQICIYVCLHFSFILQRLAQLLALADYASPYLIGSLSSLYIHSAT
jgi:hypothetical protein